jgi:hypothetical protein
VLVAALGSILGKPGVRWARGRLWRVGTPNPKIGEREGDHNGWLRC